MTSYKWETNQNFLLKGNELQDLAAVTSTLSDYYGNKNSQTTEYQMHIAVHALSNMVNNVLKREIEAGTITEIKEQEPVS